MNFIKKLLFRWLGLERYLIVVSKLFFIFYRLGLLRMNRSYDCHYYVKKLINKGDIIIDIGANLGYYTKIFAELTGIKGKVYAVEPVSLFMRVLTRNLRKYRNIELMPYALGKEDKTKVRMGIPRPSKYLSHGRTHVMDGNNVDDAFYITEALMRNPDRLFKDLTKLDYIKCDVEGYEADVIPEFREIIARFLPVIQIETIGENRSQIYRMLEKMDYSCFWVHRSKLLKMDKPEAFSSGDLIFIPSRKI